jgi:Rieske Fe-S protein
VLAEGSRVGISIQVEGLSKSFGSAKIWEDVTLDIPAGEVSVLLGPSGTGKSVFLKSLIGLLRPERGKIIVDGTNMPVKAEDLTVGGLISAIPADLPEVQEIEGNLNARGKAAILVVRMDPRDIRSQQGDGWDYQGILAFSKICTHVGCPIALYEQRTHHLLCPCHQSTFDLADSGNVIFGPAARRMPQLPIGVDEEGYLVAMSDFAEPVGPSFWERG